MSNLLVVNPPFKFEDSLIELNNMFRPVERFEVIYHSESISKSTDYTFNLIGSICGYVSASNHTDAMIERYAIIESALDESLKQYKIKIDAVVKNVKEKIVRGLEIFRKEVEKVISGLKQEYRILREKINDKLKKEALTNKIKESFKKLYINIKNVIKTTLDTFKDKFSNYDKYVKLNDEYLELERKYINLIKSEVR